MKRLLLSLVLLTAITFEATAGCCSWWWNNPVGGTLAFIGGWGIGPFIRACDPCSDCVNPCCEDMCDTCSDC